MQSKAGAQGLTSPMAASCSPDMLAGSLMRKLLVSTTHWPEATAQDSRSRQSVQAGRDSADSMALPLVEGVQHSSIRTESALEQAQNTGVKDTGDGLRGACKSETLPRWDVSSHTEQEEGVSCASRLQHQL